MIRRLWARLRRGERVPQHDLPPTLPVEDRLRIYKASR